MWGFESDRESSDEGSISDDDEEQQFSRTNEFKKLEFPKEEGKTFFNVGKCAKFSLEISFPKPDERERRLKVKLNLLTPCPLWIRSTSEIGFGDPIKDHEDFHRLHGLLIDRDDPRPYEISSDQMGWMEESNKPNGDTLTLSLNYRLAKCCCEPEKDLKCQNAKDSFPLLSSLSSTMEALFDSGDSSDAIFQVGDVEFPVHKLILSSRYEYFKTLFSSGLKESQTNRVVVEDANADTVKEVLRFVYRGLPPADLHEKAAEYLPIADRYGMQGLKSLCSASLKRFISSESALETFALAQLYSCTDLKRAVVKHVDGDSFKPPASLLEKAVDHFVVAKGEDNKDLQKFAASVFGKVLEMGNVYPALELAQRQECPKLVKEVVKFADKPPKGLSFYHSKKIFEEAKEQLPIAHRDANKDLKKVCSGLLGHVIEPQNLCQVLLLAHQNKCPPLKKICLRKLDDWKDHLNFKDKAADEAFPLLEKYPALKKEVKAVWDAIQLLQANRK